MKKNPQTDPVGHSQSPAHGRQAKPMREPGGVGGRSRKSDTPKLGWRGFLLGILLAAGCCISWASSSKDTTVPTPDGMRLNLTLKGYNYTSRYIDGFSVNGQGGGNLYVSGPTSGGGGRVCCVSYVYGAAAPEVTVRWQSGACMYRDSDGSAEGNGSMVHGFYREMKVKVSKAIPPTPSLFEVHFYPDGHVEAAITERASSPRLVYSKDRADRSDFPRCPGDKKPK